MNHGRLIKGLAVLLALVVVGGFLLMAGGSVLSTKGATAEAQTCTPPAGGGTAAAAGQYSAGLDDKQRGIADAIISIGKQRNLPSRAWQVAIQAGKTESGLKNLNYGDRDSLGIFQMRPSMGWGTVTELQDIPYQVNKFYTVLLAVPEWEKKRPGDAAQAVERSAFPDRYNGHEALAVGLLAELAGVTGVTGGCADPITATAKDGWTAPTQGVITSGYGPRWGGFHAGIDIAAPARTPVVAAFGGVVTYADCGGNGYGCAVVIGLPDGRQMRYGHLQTTPAVQVGHTVPAGTRLGGQGATGNVTGVHLHLEVYAPGPKNAYAANGTPIDPKPILETAGITYQQTG